MQGTITWFNCDETKPPLSSDPVWEDRKQSDKILLYNIKTRLLTDGYWIKDYNGMAGIDEWCTNKGSSQPTHWAFINYPEE